MPRWQPTASRVALQARADLNRAIHRFFAQRGVLEVETPLLCASAGTDPALEPLQALYPTSPGGNADCRFLQTSPEFAMKRLLAAGAGPIYQLCKAFRGGERGRRHNPEFTMLEWYRPGFSLSELMDEVEALLREALALPAAVAVERSSYAALFQRHLDIDPHRLPLADLRTLTLRRLAIAADALQTRADCLDLLYGHCIEPTLLEPVFIFDYPREQAALARIGLDAEGRQVARRFELVMRGMEIANGYDELCDAGEQAARFASDRRQRAARDLPDMQPDTRLLAALEAGLPASAGVALGVDRLLMLRLGSEDIAEVLAFPFDVA